MNIIEKLQWQNYYAMIAGWADRNGVNPERAVRLPAYTVPGDVLKRIQEESGVEV